jgi:hypothetical protein
MGISGSFEAWVLIERYAVVIRKAPVIAANTYTRLRMFSKLFDWSLRLFWREEFKSR